MQKRAVRGADEPRSPLFLCSSAHKTAVCVGVGNADGHTHGESAPNVHRM